MSNKIKDSITSKVEEIREKAKYKDECLEKCDSFLAFYEQNKDKSGIEVTQETQETDTDGVQENVKNMIVYSDIGPIIKRETTTFNPVINQLITNTNYEGLINTSSQGEENFTYVNIKKDCVGYGDTNNFDLLEGTYYDGFIVKDNKVTDINYSDEGYGISMWYRSAGVKAIMTEKDMKNYNTVLGLVDFFDNKIEETIATANMTEAPETAVEQ